MSDAAAAAAAIADGLCADAIHHEGRCTWIAPKVEEVRGTRPSAVFVPLGGSVYDGTAGVALFLAEAWVGTGDPRQRATARAAARHAISRVERNPSGGLHAGVTGAAWAIARVGRLLGDEDLLGAVPALCALEPPAVETDLLSGAAGTALGRAALEGARRALPLAEEVARRAEWHGDACSWATGRAADRAANLLGLSHGASGIALALAEIGVASGRDDLLAVARGGFAYEREAFDQAEGDWPDLRLGPGGGTGGPSFAPTWCNGAPGIALARIRAHDLLGDPVLLDEARIALALTARGVEDWLSADGSDFGLCHGIGGGIDVLLRGARALHGEGVAWEALARAAAEHGVRRYHDTGEPWPCGWGSGASPALMDGSAGIGLMLLSVADARVETPLLIEVSTEHVGPIPSEEVLNAR